MTHSSNDGQVGFGGIVGRIVEHVAMIQVQGTSYVGASGRETVRGYIAVRGRNLNQAKGYALFWS